MTDSKLYYQMHNVMHGYLISAIPAGLDTCTKGVDAELRALGYDDEDTLEKVLGVEFLNGKGLYSLLILKEFDPQTKLESVSNFDTTVELNALFNAAEEVGAQNCRDTLENDFQRKIATTRAPVKFINKKVDLKKISQIFEEFTGNLGVTENEVFDKIKFKISEAMSNNSIEWEQAFEILLEEFIENRKNLVSQLIKSQIK